MACFGAIASEEDVCLSATVRLDSLQPQVQVIEDVHPLAMIGMHTNASVLIMLSDSLVLVR